MNNFYIIGLTGNLGSGKSAVRLVLQELGARGIDADLLTHEVMRRGSPAWFAITRLYGFGILDLKGEINRKKLGAIVFANPNALARLEQILHPAVHERIKDILRQEKPRIVVIEAVKLIEAGLHTWCDAIWVVTCKPEIQIERVARDRHMSVQDARARLGAQGSIDEKLKFANVVIDNSGDINATRALVQRAWNAIDLKAARDKTAWLYAKTPSVAASSVAATPRAETVPTAAPPVALEIRRAHKSDLDALAIALAKREHLPSPLKHEEILARFGAHGYRIAVSEQQVVAFVAWEAENLVAIAHELWAESVGAVHAIPQLLAMIEDEAKELRCEVLVVDIDPLTPKFVLEQMRDKNYVQRDLKELHRVWRQVAMDRIRPEDQLWVKLLRGELVVQPF